MNGNKNPMMSTGEDDLPQSGSNFPPNNSLPSTSAASGMLHNDSLKIRFWIEGLKGLFLIFEVSNYDIFVLGSSSINLLMCLSWNFENYIIFFYFSFNSSKPV
jgi:hypothetical protein